MNKNMNKNMVDYSNEVIDFVNRKIGALQINLPAVVTKVNGNKVNVDVMTRTMVTLTGEYRTVSLMDVPVQMWVGHKSEIKLPIKKGVTGKVTVYDLDISKLINAGNETPVKESSPKRHDISSAVFTPDFQTSKKAVTLNDNLEINNDQMTIVLYPNGKIEIKGENKELLTIISSSLNHISTFYDNMTTHLNAMTAAATALSTMGGALITPTGIDPASKSAFTTAMSTWISAIATMTGNVATDKTNITTDDTDLTEIKKI